MQTAGSAAGPTGVFIEGVGHAMLPEQPKTSAEAIIGWIRARVDDKH